MAVSNMGSAPRMDQLAGASFTTPFYSPYPGLPQLPVFTSSHLQPHRRSSSASTSSHTNRYHHQQQLLLQQHQQQQLLCFPPAFAANHQMPFQQQLPYQHQNMYDSAHSTHGVALYGNGPYIKRASSQSQGRGYQRHHLLPYAPSASQQQSSSLSVPSTRQLSALQKQQLQIQAQAWAQTPSKTVSQPPAAAATTHMPLLSAFSLRASSHNKTASCSSTSRQENKHQNQNQQKPSIVGKKPPAKGSKESRHRGPVDANELSRRLSSVLTQRELASAAGATSSAHSLSSRSTISPAPPLSRQNAPEQLLSQAGSHRLGQRIRSRGSGNLRAAYTSNGSVPAMSSTMTESGSSNGPIRRQTFSAPHLGVLAPPPSLSELERRQRRTHSLSPQQMYMHGGSAGSAGHDKIAAGQRPTAIHNMHHVPRHLAQQGTTRQSALPPKARQPYHHNQNASRHSLPLLTKSPAMSSSTTSGSARGLQHEDGKTVEVNHHRATAGDVVLHSEAESATEVEKVEVQTQSDAAPQPCKKPSKDKKSREKHEKQKQTTNASGPDTAKQMRPLWRLKARLSSFSKDKLLSSPTVTVVAVDEETEGGKESATEIYHLTDEVPRAQHVESSTVEKVIMVPSGPSVPEMAPKVAKVPVDQAVEASVISQPASPSSSVLSFTALAKSSSFLSRFKL
ncbi:hypothetical protein SEPCBS57363_006425 [Sporothrix epigloea]|uniref:Uncharacterized protein n=1 Tax=Sporothrix epigloea TaxID=1892477 RepID=A0ABP0E658_9PEZI